MKRLSFLATLVAALTLAVGATGALAGTHPDNRATHGPGAVTLEQSDDVVRPDDRATHVSGALASSQSSDPVRPDDRATHGQGAIVIEPVTDQAQVPVIAPASSKADGFDWLDAAIGSAATFGLLLIIAGGVALALRRAHAPAYS